MIVTRKNKRHETFLEEYERESIEAVDENIEEWEKRKMSEVQIDTLLKELNESNRQVFKYKVFYNLTLSRNFKCNRGLRRLMSASSLNALENESKI